MDWNVVRAFFETSHGQRMIKEALDNDEYWGKDKQGLTQDEVEVAHPEGGTDTTVALPDKGSECDYDIESTEVESTNATVETIVEAHEAIEEVACKEPNEVKDSVEAPVVKAAKIVFLEKLADIATKLDEKGLTEEADQIDQIIREETQQ